MDYNWTTERSCRPISPLLSNVGPSSPKTSAGRFWRWVQSSPDGVLLRSVALWARHLRQLELGQRREKTRSGATQRRPSATASGPAPRLDAFTIVAKSLSRQIDGFKALNSVLTAAFNQSIESSHPPIRPGPTLFPPLSTHRPAFVALHLVVNHGIVKVTDTIQYDHHGERQARVALCFAKAEFGQWREQVLLV